MAYLDHNEANEDFREKVVSGIQQHFPIKGRLQTLELEGVEVRDDDLHSDDIRKQHKVKVDGGSLSAPVYANLVLKNNTTGKVVDRRKVRLAEVPMMTRRYSYLVDGKEYQIDNQWQLKPGVYTRRRQTGELESQFNIADKPEFKVLFDPKSKQFSMQRGKSKIPIYPLMKAMGVDDDTLERQWGKDVVAANRDARGVNTALEKFYKADRRAAPKDEKEAATYFIETMQQSSLRPDATRITLGKEYSAVDGDVLAKATKKILDVHKGTPEDDRDSLEFKDLRTASDFAFDKLTDWKTSRAIRGRAMRKINTASNIRDLVKFDSFNRPVRDIFQSAAARIANQTNPVEMISASQQTTLLGPGGIQSEQKILDEAKFINPSHMGYLDPLHTPESAKTGVTLRLPLGVKKSGKEVQMPLYNLKTGKTEYVNPTNFGQKKVVLPDQVRWKDGKPIPVDPVVKLSVKGNEIEEGRFGEADYVMKHPSQIFNLTTNLIPFLGNTSGVRARAATSHIEQAISLAEREAPLVQTATGQDSDGIRTFEELVGRRVAGHAAPDDGIVESVTNEAITIKGKDGRKHEVQLYNNFPLNDPKAVIHSEVRVKPGQKVKSGDSVADTNYTKDGQLALGTNLRVAYVPFKGYNFEDGVVISESAAKKLSSIHMKKPSVRLEEEAITDPKKFQVQHPGAFKKDQFEKLDGTGVVQVGQKVMPGDPLVLATKPFRIGQRFDIRSVRKSAGSHHTDTSLTWDSDQPGEVVAVHKKGSDVTVHVRTVEPMRVGDKIAGRYGNKGIVAKIERDDEMPRTTSGDIVEVALNPSGVPGRMNVGQVLETAAAKIAKKTGKPYIIDNFAPKTDQLAKVKADLKKHGLTDTEELEDPVTGVRLGKALVGHQHMLKLTHQIDKKTSVRSGMSVPGEEQESYDLNLMPSGGGKTGGQSMGSLGMYTLLAHGAKANIREMQTWKSEGPDPKEKWPSQHRQVWSAIQTGEPLPTPKPTFAYHKFESMLRATGINVDKKGHNLQLTPLTDSQILGMSSGQLQKASELTYAKLDDNGDPKPKKEGLFDPKKTGGHGGTKWSHIALAEPIPNPVFEGAIQKVTGLSKKNYNAIVQGQKAVDREGNIVDVGVKGSTAGGAAIKQMLDAIDIDKELPKAEAELMAARMPKSFSSSSTGKIDKTLKKVKHLRALKEVGVKPSDAYVLNNLPVLPPIMRPASVLPTGDIKWDDLNGLYSKFSQINEKLADPVLSKNLGDANPTKQEMRASLYDGVKAIMGLGTLKGEDKEERGILHQIHGTQPKKGYFQKTLMNRRQDMTMRSVIVPEPALGLDEIGLPRKHAKKALRAFAVRKLVEMGSASNPLEAQKMIDADDQSTNPTVTRALELVAKERPAIVKRDPALHSYSVQGFQPRLVDGNAVQIHPLVTSGFNADFDGDTMSVYIPISREAVDEARKMFPSNNLFSEASGRVMYQPTLESALGLYKMTRVSGDSGKKFKSDTAALDALRTGKVKLDQTVQIGSEKTTPGRILLSGALPGTIGQEIRKNHEKVLDKKGVDELFTRVAKEHKDEFGNVANALKDLGNGAAYGAIAVAHPNHKGPNAIMAAENSKEKRVFLPVGTHSLSLDDFTPDRGVRDPILAHAQRKVDRLRDTDKDEKTRKANEIWGQAADLIQKEHIKRAKKNPNNLFLMQEAGVKPGWDQYKQLVLAPVQVTKPTGELASIPIKKSYSEGLDLGEYWTQSHGARHGTVMKVQEVQDPGVFSKQLINTSMNLVVSGEDCGTGRGTALPVGDNDVFDRILARDFKAKGTSFKAGTTLSPDVVDQIRKVDKNAQVIVRSSLKCEHGTGVCQKCAGLNSDGRLFDMGTNVGVISAQSLGERATQLTLKAFHAGGVRSAGKARVLNNFKRIQQLTSLPEKVPDAAELAMQSGTIDKVEEDPTGTRFWIGGKEHFVGRDRAGKRLDQAVKGITDPSTGWTPPKKGMRVEAGQPLSDPSRTLVNPRDLYKATGSIEKVQNFLVNELHGIYKEQGVKRPHVENMVKSMSNLTRVREPGDMEHVLRGEFRPMSQLRAENTDLVKRGKRPAEHEPVLKGIDVMPLAVQEDWMAKLMHNRLRSTITDAAAEAAVSNIHGPHPVPGMAYGAEFGLTEKDSLKPGLHHLADVPKHSY